MPNPLALAPPVRHADYGHGGNRLNYALDAVSAVAGLPPLLLYLAVLLWLVLESAGAPLPNEAILLFSGYLVAIGHLDASLVVVAATIGSCTGATLAWWIARTYGPAGVERVGRFVFLNRGRLAAAQAWFDRWGPHTIFLARLTPVVRTVISYPAGLAAMRYRPFIVATIVGAGLYNLVILLIGRAAGPHWIDLFERFHTPALLLGIVVILLVAAYVAFEHAVKKRFAQS
jgi:membrane protein DedA with SNARE-associated domain